MEREVILKAEKINKSFGPTKAVVDFSMEICAGEIHGLIGENGSGKSTFSNVISGIHRFDSGKLSLNGADYTPVSTGHASDKGVALVVQEAGVITSLSVAGNIFLNKEKRFSSMLGISYKEMNAAAKAALEKIGVDHISPASMTSMLNLEERKLVEIAKAMRDDPSVLIIDETSNALTTAGRELLYNVIRMVKDYGGAVLFITHDLDELIRICDCVTIMRDGRYVATLQKEDMQIHRLKELMVGREIAENYYRADTEPSCEPEVVLRAENLVATELRGISFELRKGEILGVGGLSDCGMHDLGRALFGIEKLDSGRVVLGNGVEIRDAQTAVQNKVGYMSKNRDTEAIILQFPIGDNICLPSLEQLMRKKLIFKRDERALAQKWSDRLSIKMRSLKSYCSTLSGGNKQKVVLAKWLGNESRILIMDCPTRGIDIGVKEKIYSLMQELKAQGVSIIMISEEMPELIGMSDRILVMKDFEISAVLERSEDLDEKTVIGYMI